MFTSAQIGRINRRREPPVITNERNLIYPVCTATAAAAAAAAGRHQAIATQATAETPTVAGRYSNLCAD